MACYSFQELKELLTPFKFYHKWFNQQNQFLQAGTLQPQTQWYIPEDWFRLLGGGSQQLNCMLSQRDLLDLLDRLGIRPTQPSRRQKFDAAFVRTQTQFLREKNQMLNTNCKLLVHFLPRIRAHIKRSNGIRVFDPRIDTSSLDPDFQKLLSKSDKASDLEGITKQSIGPKHVQLNLGSYGALYIKRSSRNTFTVRRYSNRAFQTFNRLRLVNLMSSIGFPTQTKHQLLDGMVATWMDPDPNKLVDVFNRNVRQFLGAKYAKQKGYIDRVFGAGVFGITFGIRFPDNSHRALKIVSEEDVRAFEQETKLHRLFAKAGLAPKMFPGVYQNKKKVEGRYVMAYTMEPIHGVVDSVFSTRLPYPESKRLVVQVGEKLIRLVRSTAERKYCHGDMHGGNVGYLRRSGSLSLDKLLLIDFGWSSDLSKYSKGKHRTLWPFRDFSAGGWPMYDILQFLRGGILDICEELEKKNISKWMRDHFSKPFNRLMLVCSMFAESFVSGFRKWLQHNSRRRFDSYLRKGFRTARTSTEPATNGHVSAFFERHSRSDKDLLLCCKEFVKVYVALKKAKRSKKPIAEALRSLNTLYTFLDNMFEKYVKKYKKLIQ